MMSYDLKHIVINDEAYLVEAVVFDWHLALSRENERLREDIKILKAGKTGCPPKIYNRKNPDSWRM